MKRIFIVITLFIPINLHAQQFRKFLIASDLGLVNGTSFTANSFTLEPGYRISDKILMGVRIEQTSIFPIGRNISGNSMSVGLGSFGINAHYYFQTSRNRFFCGGGMGIFNPPNNFLLSNTDRLSQRNGLGIYSRAGWDFKHLRVMIEYNFIQKMEDYIYSDNPPGTGHYQNFDKSYLSVKVGFFVGGGRKK